MNEKALSPQAILKTVSQTGKRSEVETVCKNQKAN
jgi:hypothetical protein